MFSKFFVLTFCVFLNSVAGFENANEIIESCAEEVGISADEIRKFDFQEDHMPKTEDELNKYKCFFKCYMVHSQVMEADGKIHPDKFYNGAALTLPCLDLVSDDVCDKAYHVMECATHKQRAGILITNATYECGLAAGADRDEVIEFLSKNKTETDNENIKCYLKCFYQRVTIMDEDGNLMAPKVKIDAYSEENVAKIKHCFDVTGKDLCEKALNFYVCEKPLLSPH